MYFDDLIPYSYMGFKPDPNVLTIGWLDNEHRFPKGKVSEDTLNRILALCFKPVNQTRGFYPSQLCGSYPFGYPIEFKGRKMLLGSAEIRVEGKNGKSYAAPNLIYHYMKDCDYLPPREFLDALNTMEIPEL